MNKNFIIPFIAGAATILLAGIAFVYFFYYNKPHRDVVFAEPDFSLRANEIALDFIENPEEANKFFLDKILEIIGTVKNINIKDSITVVEFQDHPDYVISMRLLPEYSSKANKLQIDEYAKIKGIYDGFQAPDDLFGPGVLMFRRSVIVD